MQWHLQIVEIQKGLSRNGKQDNDINLQIVEIQKGLSLNHCNTAI